MSDWVSIYLPGVCVRHRITTHLTLPFPPPPSGLHIRGLHNAEDDRVGVREADEDQGAGGGRQEHDGDEDAQAV